MGTDIVDADGYQTVPMQTDHVIACLREQGFRITKQRKLLIDIILSELMLSGRAGRQFYG